MTQHKSVEAGWTLGALDAIGLAASAVEQIGLIARGAATSHGDDSGALQMIDGYAGDAFQAMSAALSSARGNQS